MTTLPYYPGCTLNTVAKAFDQSARDSFRILGIELSELAQWNCCGASFPLTPNNIIGLTGPTNVLVQSQKAGGIVSTLCSFCYNTLKRTNLAIKEDPERREVINDFLGTEYKGEVEVLHLLEVLRDKIGFSELKKFSRRNLKKIKVAAYYGCTLLRPNTVAIDSSDSPAIFENFLKALGCEAVDFPHKGECCGSHLAMSHEEIVIKLSGVVMASARESGAELVTTTCPLCFYNIERSQKSQIESESGAPPLPVLYFTQLLGLALGVGEGRLGLENNLIDPRPLLKARGIIGEPQTAKI